MAVVSGLPNLAHKCPRRLSGIKDVYCEVRIHVSAGRVSITGIQRVVRMRLKGTARVWRIRDVNECQPSQREAGTPKEFDNNWPMEPVPQRRMGEQG